ncbi:MAG: helix-turn-helix domain-containing protein [Roseibium sp.]
MAKPKQVPIGGWDQHSIKAEVHRQGMTLSQLAKSAGITANSFSHVWTRTVSRAEEAISAFLETPKENLFPDRYPKRSARILSSKYEGYGERQKDVAAPDREAA